MGKIIDKFGELTFNKNVMRQRLSKPVYEKLMASIHQGAALDSSIAGEVAHAMKEWAILNGATHFTHWFQPLRGGTAEKHDAFITYDDRGDIIERFSASQLIQSEPDASSFPSGGIRSTFEARGYTAWDPTSPAFLLESEDTKTLVIPTVFLSWTGEVLDMKAPYLRSLRALNESAISLQRLLGNRMPKRIRVYAGPEQEYFLASKELVETRLDLKLCGRTLFGAMPIKGQQMEDHYFGSIKDKVMKFMEDLDMELYRRGIPSKTRHNEVAPNQFEVAVLYQEANLAIDMNLQLMTILKKTASKHGMSGLLHEKPYAGVNGSGKHYNWSIGDDTGANYLEPSKSPLKNISFLVTIGAILLGVKKFGGLLRASVADAGNDHRLGANEAPPAIMSVYLGDYLEKLMATIEGIGKVTFEKMTEISVGVQNMPKLAKDYSDRNRTSPIAFTGNKFEFRAVGSSQNCSDAAVILNLMAAYGYDIMKSRIAAKKGDDVRTTALEILKDVIKETKAVRFEGNNYSKEWHAEAEKRGLPNAKDTPSALEYYTEKDAVELFTKYKVLSERELESKIEIKYETYVKIKDIEFNTAIEMAHNQILPAVARAITEKATAVNSADKCGAKCESLKKDVKALCGAYDSIQDEIESLEKITGLYEKEGDAKKKAAICAGKGADALLKLRNSVDSAELLVPDDLWPVAKYQDLLTKL